MPSRAFAGLLVAGSLIPSWLALAPTLLAQNTSGPPPVGDPIRGAKIALSCSRCHGEGGISTDAWIPRLDGLDQRAISKQLDDYRRGRRRPEWYMASIARAL